MSAGGPARKDVILITGASSGFGSLAARAPFTKGTSHYEHAGSPGDLARASEYEMGPYAGLPAQILRGMAALEPPEADAATVVDAIVRVVGLPFGKRPFRTTIDPSQDGAEIVNGVAARVRAELLRRIGLEDLLTPQVSTRA
jgi:NAD(P)-dependent dehydrogenase (short-subunit alcohol dehydrogenase family)